MKNFIIICLLFLASKVLSQNNNTGLHNIASPYLTEDCKNIRHYNLLGNIYSIDTKTFNRPVLKENIDSIVLVKRNSQGPFNHEKKYFDSLGFLTKSLNISGLFGVEFIYDSIGRLDSINSLRSEYNNNTNEGRYGEYFTINHSVIMDWSTYENKVIGIGKDINEERKDTVIYALDSNKNIVRIERIFNGIKLPTYLYRYDSSNRIISSRIINSQGVEKFYWSITYDNNGYLVRNEKKDLNGNLKETITKIRDSFGNVVQVELISSNSYDKYEYNYEYDEIGNWIFCTTKRNGEFVNLQYRKIEYYN